MKRILAVIQFALFATVLTAQQTLTLDSVFQNIEKNNPLLLSYENRIKADKALINSAKVWMPPLLGVEFDRNPYSFDNFYSGVVRTSVMQYFPNRKFTDARKNYFGSLEQIDLHESTFQKNKIFNQAKAAYYGIYIAQKRIKVIKDNIALIQSMIELSQKLMATGKGDLASIFKLKARLTTQETMLVHEENLVKTHIATLNYLMAKDINQVFNIDTNSIIKNYRNLGYTFTSDIIETKRSDVMQMNSTINSMKLNKDVALLRTRPTFGLRLEHFAFAKTADMFSVMGTMTLPFAPWVSKSYKSEARSMEYRIAAMEQEKGNMVNMALQMIKMLVIEMNSEYQEIDNYTQKVLPAYKKSLDAYVLAYSQNTSDLNMVLMAYDDLQMSQMEYIRHLETLFKVQIEYEKELQIR